LGRKVITAVTIFWDVMMAMLVQAFLTTLRHIPEAYIFSKYSCFDIKFDS
jgi:hypothetical protein